MKFLSTLVGALVLASAVPGTAHTQTGRLHVGPRLSYHFDAEKVGVGAQLGIPIAQHVELYPSFDYFLVDAGSFMHINGDLKFRFPHAEFNWLYVGGGLNLSRGSAGGRSNTDAGANLFFGAESRKGAVHPFGEIRFVSNNGSSAVGVVGLNFTLAGSR